MNYTGPKVRLSRQLGLALTPKAAKIMERKPHPPGQHGNAKRRTKKSDYALQLLEKQRLRFQYNISERQLRNYYMKASRRTGNTGELMVQALEQRLDALVLRAGFARSIYAARQYVTHGHFTVNGRPVNLPAYSVRPGDVIAVRPRSRKVECLRHGFGIAVLPQYLQVSQSELSVQLLRTPMRDEIPVICDVTLVVEYYSR